MKKIIAFVITIMFLFSIFSPIASYAASVPAEIFGDTAILIDGATGTILYSKNIDKQKYPASTTKIMTALLVLESCDLDDVVVIDAETPYTTGSRVYLIEGEEITVRELLYCLLLASANDAADALAKHVSGSVEAFADLMNQRAVELGATNTQFTNPHGLPDEAHLTTAHDLAMIAKELMKHDVAREIVSTYQMTIEQTNKQDTRYLHNSNRMLWDTKRKVEYNGELRPLKYDDVTGVKTGYTNAAGSCLVSSAKRGDTELIAVVLESDVNELYLDTIKLLEYGFDNYETVKLSNSGDIVGQVVVKSGSDKNIIVDAIQSKDVYYTIEKGAFLDAGKFKTVQNLPSSVNAPVLEGQALGTIATYDGETLISEVVLLASADASESIWVRFGEWAKQPGNYYKTILLIIGILAALYLALVIAVRIINKRRRQKYNARRRRRQSQ